MKSTLIRKLLLVAALGIINGLLLLSWARAEPVDRLPEARLDGTFIQLWPEHQRWTPGQWANIFGSFRQLHIHQVVIQWTVYDENAYYLADPEGEQRLSAVESIMQQADRAGIHVLVGLVNDSAYWEKIQRAPPLVEAYLSRSASQSIKAAEQMARIMERHPSFLGWYIPEEIDDITWREPEARKVLFAHLDALSWELHRLTPKAVVALSAFSNGAMDPVVFEAFWSGLLAQAPQLSLVLLQDGVGAGKLTLTEFELYLAAMSRATHREHAKVEVVVEIFRQVDGPPINNRAFRGEPAPLSRIVEQISLAKQYGLGAVAFSLPDYMNPMAGGSAQDLFQAYVAYLRTGSSRHPMVGHGVPAVLEQSSQPEADDLGLSSSDKEVRPALNGKPKQ